MTDIEQRIRSEIYKAIESLGGPPERLAATINDASKGRYTKRRGAWAAKHQINYGAPLVQCSYPD
jgi:hypothetical protein